MTPEEELLTRPVCLLEFTWSELVKHAGRYPYPVEVVEYARQRKGRIVEVKEL